MPLIDTRKGAIAYLAAPVVLLVLFACLLFTGGSDPFAAEYVATFLPRWLLLLALLAFTLPAAVLLARWVVSQVSGPGQLTPGMALLYIPAGLLMCIPAVFCGIPIWLWTLVSVLRRNYPADEPIRWLPVLSMLAVLVLISGCSLGSSWYENRRCSQPAATAEASYRLYKPDAVILAQIPCGEDEMLIISSSGSGVFTRSEEGWTLKSAYQTTLQSLVSAAGSGSLTICRNPNGGEDVVIVSQVSLEGDALLVPVDTAGSIFTEVTWDMGTAVGSEYYALVDADAPGYAVSLE